LAAQYHFDEATGTTLADSSGSGNTGIIRPGVTWAKGRLGAALSFNGDTGWVEVPGSPSLEPSSAVTVSAWVRNTGSPGAYRYILAKGATGCVAASYGLYTGPNGGLQFYVSQNRGTTYVRSPDAGVQVWDGNWHMVLGEYDGSSVRLFVDGTEVGTGAPRRGPLEYVLPDSNDLYVGDYPGCQLHTFVGTIDELDVWGRALSASEVQAAFEQVTSGGGSGAGVKASPEPPASNPRRGAGVPRSPRATIPAIRALTIKPSAFPLTIHPADRAARRAIGATITYVTTAAGRTRFVLLARRLGERVRGTCTVRPGHVVVPHKRRCILYVRVGGFDHADSVGSNRVRFDGLRGRGLSPGKYRLTATPAAQGQRGRTVSVAFTLAA
jgi:hypothetical protein